MGPCYGPGWILVGSVLWAPILYMVYNWYVLGSELEPMLGAHSKTLGMVHQLSLHLWQERRPSTLAMPPPQSRRMHQTGLAFSELPAEIKVPGPPCVVPFLYLLWILVRFMVRNFEKELQMGVQVSPWLSVSG